MGRSADRKFGPIAGLAFALGAATILPSLAALAVAIFAAVALFF